MWGDRAGRELDKQLRAVWRVAEQMTVYESWCKTASDGPGIAIRNLLP